MRTVTLEAVKMTETQSSGLEGNTVAVIKLMKKKKTPSSVVGLRRLERIICGDDSNNNSEVYCIVFESRTK